MKILVLLTGGTIGSSVSGGVISADENTSSLLTHLYKEKYGGGHSFTVKRIMNTLSENLGKASLSEMANSVIAEDFSGFDGAVITHGTDTLHFSSPLLAFLLRNKPCPAAVVSADYPLTDERSNGVDNFASAISLFESGEGEKGKVYVPWKNRKGENQIHLGVRVCAADCFSDDITSFGGEVYGEVKNGAFVKNQAFKTLPEDGFDFDIKEFSIEKTVLTLLPYPSFDYSLISFGKENKPAAVLQRLYHSATACTVGESESACKFIKKCAEEGVPVYGCSFKDLKGSLYETCVSLLESGLIPLINTAPEAAFAKLLFAYNCGFDNPAEIMKKNLCGEIL